MHERNESEAILSEHVLDLERVDDPYLRILLEEALEDEGEFQEVFSTNFQREFTELHFPDGTIIEVALDIGEITCPDKQSKVSISEVELELKKGNAQHLFDISRQLISEKQFAISNASKARRGYTCCTSLPATHRRMAPIELTKGIEAETSFEMICYTGLKHWQYYEQFIESDIAADAILQMYRALIYIQHVYHVFGMLIPRSATADLRANWSWMSEFMQDIVDVARQKQHLEKLKDSSLNQNQFFQQQIKENDKALELAIERFRKVQNSERYNLIMLGLSEWLFFKRWRPFIDDSSKIKLKAPIVDFAQLQLDHMLRELRRDFGLKHNMQVFDYLQTIGLLRRALDMGLFFGCLFDSKRRQQYRQPWLDLLAGTRELLFNLYAADCYRLAGEKSAEEASKWLEQQNDSVMEAMEQTRLAVFKNKPYWSMS